MQPSHSAASLIPESLLPSDGRFGSGPSKVRPEALGELLEAAPGYLGTSHRQAPVQGVVEQLRRGLAELFRLPDGYEVALGVGGATVFWDMSAFCLVERRSQHCSFGEFSSRFAAAVASAAHLQAPMVLESPPGTCPEPVADASIDAYALTQNETSTGVAMEVVRPAGAEGIVVVDATSAAGGTLIDPSEFDAYFFSPQKCFGSDAGLWVALLSPQALARAASLPSDGRSVPPSLDLGVAIESSRKQQTYNTPPLVSLFLMQRQVEWMLDNGGLSWAAARCDASAEVVYGWAERAGFAEPFVKDPKKRSHVVATVDLDLSVDASLVSRVLRHNGIVDVEPYRKLQRNQLRIALFPAIEKADVEALCACVDWVVESCT